MKAARSEQDNDPRYRMVLIAFVSAVLLGTLLVFVTSTGSTNAPSDARPGQGPVRAVRRRHQGTQHVVLLFAAVYLVRPWSPDPPAPR